MEANFTLPQAELRRRLTKLLSDGKVRPGRKAVNFAHELRVADVAVYIGMGYYTLCQVAKNQRAISDTEQIRLTQFFTSWDRGELIKVKEGEHWTIQRQTGRVVPPAPQGAPKLTIEVGPQGPRFKRLPPV